MLNSRKHNISKEKQKTKSTNFIPQETGERQAAKIK